MVVVPTSPEMGGAALPFESTDLLDDTAIMVGVGCWAWRFVCRAKGVDSDISSARITN